MTVIDESQTAKGYTPAAQVPAVFGQPRTIEGIVIHHWGVTGQRHEDVVDFFVNGPGATSAHFVASAGKLTCLVSPPDAAWHCPGKNATHIGIECRPEATDEDYATVAELVRTLRAQYGNLPLSMHRDWYSTACPGVWDLGRIDQLASGSAAIAAQGTTTPPQEYDMTQEETNQIIEKLTTAVAAIDKIKQATNTLPGQVDEHSITYWDDLIHATARIDAGTANAPQIAAQLNAAGLAESVRDELVKLIGGNK